MKKTNDNIKTQKRKRETKMRRQNWRKKANHTRHGKNTWAE